MSNLNTAIQTLNLSIQPDVDKITRIDTTQPISTIEVGKNVLSEMAFIKSIIGQIERGKLNITKPMQEELESIKASVKTSSSRLVKVGEVIDEQTNLKEYTDYLAKLTNIRSNYDIKLREEAKLEKNRLMAEEKTKIDLQAKAKLDAGADTEYVEIIKAMATEMVEKQVEQTNKVQKTFTTEGLGKVSTRETKCLEVLDKLAFIKWIVDNPEFVDCLEIHAGNTNTAFKPTASKTHNVIPDGIEYRTKISYN